MRGNPGKIVQWIGKDGLKTGIMYHARQEKKFIEAKKALVNQVDNHTFEPILQNGDKLITLVDLSRLRVIGQVD
jgi:hypothetical protein